MPRFYIEPRSIKEKKVNIRGAEARHIKTVLRLGKGDMINIFDGTGREYAVLIENVSPARVEGRIIEDRSIEVESLVDVTLFQGLPKSGKMDLIIQKCTELGVHRIVPVLTSRTIPEIDPKKMKTRKLRWERIAREAARQSGRTRIPEIGDVISFSDVFGEEADLKLIFWEGEREAQLKDVLGRCRVAAYPCRVGLFVGPEGGFGREEIGQARYKGAIPVSLGPRILRTETAGMIATAIIMYEFEPRVKNRNYSSDN